jgi:hypothetical protein
VQSWLSDKACFLVHNRGSVLKNKRSMAAKNAFWPR